MLTTRDGDGINTVYSTIGDTAGEWGIVVESVHTP